MYSLVGRIRMIKMKIRLGFGTGKSDFLRKLLERHLRGNLSAPQRRASIREDPRKGKPAPGFEPGTY